MKCFRQNFESEIIEKQPKNSQKMIHEKIEKDMAENKQKIEHRNRINSSSFSCLFCCKTIFHTDG